MFGVDPEKTQALTEASTPQYVGELMTFLGGMRVDGYVKTFLSMPK